MRILIDKERLGFVARKDSAVADDDVFIGDGAIKIYVFAGYGILHNDTVLDVGILADLYTAEEDRIFDRTLDNTAVGDKRITHDGAGYVGSGRRIAYLCEYGTVFDREERSAYFGV